MRSVYRTVTIPVLLVCSIFSGAFFSSCADKIKTDIIAFEALDEGLVNSNATIDKSSQTLYASLEQKTTEPSTREKAKRWLSKAMLIQKLSADAYKYIEELKTDLKKEAGLKINDGVESFKENDKMSVMRLFEKNDKGKELFEHLKTYKHDLLAVDEELEKEFNNTILLTTRAFDVVKEKQDFHRTFFDDIPVAAALALLSKFQNNITVNENRMVAFCSNKVGDYGDRYYDYYSIFAGISSSAVNAGDEIEITSGIGAFSKAAQPIITINGKSVVVDADGAAHYKFKASDKPGKHSVPVQIGYTDQEGKKQTITKNLEYTVAQ